MRTRRLSEHVNEPSKSDLKLGRIAIVGAGAVGAYYGAQLARAGEEVRFLMRRDLAAVRAHGLTIRLHQPVRTQFHLDSVYACGTTAEIGPVDIVLIGLKATANAALATLIPPLLHEQTAIYTLQNGLGNEEYLAELFGAQRVGGGLCFICLNRAEPGTVDCFLPGSIRLGEWRRPAGPHTHALAAAWRRVGVDASASDDLAAMRWRKLVWNVPFNGLTIAAGSITTDRILQDPGLLAETRALMREIQAAAAAQGCEIPDEFLEKQIEVTAAMGAYKPSSLVDYLDGRAVEVEAIWGEPLRRARAAGVATPHLAALYEKLRTLCVVPAPGVTEKG